MKVGNTNSICVVKYSMTEGKHELAYVNMTS